MRRLLLCLAAACITACATPALTHLPPPGTDDFVLGYGCMDDDGRSLCDGEAWSDIVTKFGLEPAEAAQRAGQRGVRVFTVNGYGRDMPAISILAKGAGSKRKWTLVAHWEWVNARGKVELASLSHSAPPDLQDATIELLSLVEKSPTQQPDETPGDRDIICLHPWGTVTESLTDRGVTRHSRSACGSDPLFDASFELVEAAQKALPDCGGINPDNHRNASAILARCFALGGTDRGAATEVMNLIDSGVDWARDLKPLLSADVSLTLPDQPAVDGAAAVALALADKPFADAGMYMGRFAGEADRVNVSGELSTYPDPDTVEVASLHIDWQRRDGEWRITLISVGAFKVAH